MPNEIQYVGIVGKDYNNRGLIIHNANTSPLVRQSNGTLFAAIRENNVNNYISLYRSQDLGFSWERVWAGNFTAASDRRVGVYSLNQSGSWMSLTCHEQANRIILWHSYFGLAENVWDLQPFVWKITDPTTLITDANEVAALDKIGLDADQGAAIVVANEATAFIVWVSHAKLWVNPVHPTFTKLTDGGVTLGTQFFNVFHATADQNGNVDIAILEANGINMRIRYVPFTQTIFLGAGTFGTPVTIASITGQPDILDICISKDGVGTLLVVWGQKTLDGTDMDVYYSISKDKGVTWSAAQVINKTIGHSVYKDLASGQLATRATCMGGLEGFLISYCHTAGGIPKTFVRQLSSTDGITYTLGTEEQIATKTTGSDEAITGLRWFKNAGARHIALDDPGEVRVAYQVGEGNSTVQESTIPIRIGQELLKVSAYPSTLTSDTGSYLLDTALPTQIVVNCNIIGGPYEDVDYYSLGSTVVGHVTQRFLAAFKKVGTEMRFLRYDPIQSSQLNDRSAYGAPTEYTSLAVIETLTYENPISNSGIEGFRQYIERDIRKVYLPPDFSLTRNWTLNRSNFLKRTVWTTDFDGNRYELTQVSPHFLNNQICYYVANAYVIGPMSDPFSKSILPTET